MTEYRRERIEQLFDTYSDDPRKAPKRKYGQHTLVQKIEEICLEELDLKKNDVFLDMGTGTGDFAIPAAALCEKVIGIDISTQSLKIARENAQKSKSENILFVTGSFEDPCEQLKLSKFKINKILALYSLHHLPDRMKKPAIEKMCEIIAKPGIIVIGDLIFFEKPEKHRDKFNEVHYDGGETDFPAHVEFLCACLEYLGATVKTIEIHPLAGVISAKFLS